MHAGSKKKHCLLERAFNYPGNLLEPATQSPSPEISSDADLESAPQPGSSSSPCLLLAAL